MSNKQNKPEIKKSEDTASNKSKSEILLQNLISDYTKQVSEDIKKEISKFKNIEPVIITNAVNDNWDDLGDMKDNLNKKIENGIYEDSDDDIYATRILDMVSVEIQKNKATSNVTQEDAPTTKPGYYTNGNTSTVQITSPLQSGASSDPRLQKTEEERTKRVELIKKGVLKDEKNTNNSIQKELDAFLSAIEGTDLENDPKVLKIKESTQKSIDKIQAREEKLREQLSKKEKTTANQTEKKISSFERQFEKEDIKLEKKLIKERLQKEIENSRKKSQKVISREELKKRATSERIAKNSDSGQKIVGVHLEALFKFGKAIHKINAETKIAIAEAQLLKEEEIRIDAIDSIRKAAAAKVREIEIRRDMYIKKHREEIISEQAKLTKSEKTFTRTLSREEKIIQKRIETIKEHINKIVEKTNIIIPSITDSDDIFNDETLRKWEELLSLAKLKAENSKKSKSLQEIKSRQKSSSDEVLRKLKETQELKIQDMQATSGADKAKTRAKIEKKLAKLESKTQAKEDKNKLKVNKTKEITSIEKKDKLHEVEIKFNMKASKAEQKASEKEKAIDEKKKIDELRKQKEEEYKLLKKELKKKIKYKKKGIEEDYENTLEDINSETRELLIESKKIFKKMKTSDSKLAFKELLDSGYSKKEAKKLILLNEDRFNLIKDEFQSFIDKEIEESNAIDQHSKDLTDVFEETRELSLVKKDVSIDDILENNRKKVEQFNNENISPEDEISAPKNSDERQERLDKIANKGKYHLPEEKITDDFSFGDEDDIDYDEAQHTIESLRLAVKTVKADSKMAAYDDIDLDEIDMFIDPKDLESEELYNEIDSYTSDITLSRDKTLGIEKLRDIDNLNHSGRRAVLKEVKNKQDLEAKLYAVASDNKDELKTLKRVQKVERRAVSKGKAATIAEVINSDSINVGERTRDIKKMFKEINMNDELDTQNIDNDSYATREEVIEGNHTDGIVNPNKKIRSRVNKTISKSVLKKESKNIEKKEMFGEEIEMTKERRDEIYQSANSLRMGKIRTENRNPFIDWDIEKEQRKKSTDASREELDSEILGGNRDNSLYLDKDEENFAKFLSSKTQSKKSKNISADSVVKSTFGNSDDSKVNHKERIKPTHSNVNKKKSPDRKSFDLKIQMPKNEKNKEKKNNQLPSAESFDISSIVRVKDRKPNMHDKKMSSNDGNKFGLEIGKVTYGSDLEKTFGSSKIRKSDDRTMNDLSLANTKKYKNPYKDKIDNNQKEAKQKAKPQAKKDSKIILSKSKRMEIEELNKRKDLQRRKYKSMQGLDLSSSEIENKTLRDQSIKRQRAVEIYGQSVKSSKNPGHYQSTNKKNKK